LRKENVREKKDVRIVPQPKTTLDKLGDVFEEVNKDGPALVRQLGEELSKARETVRRISEKLTDGEGHQVLAELADEAQQKLDKIATDAKREAAEAEQKLARTAAEARQKAEEANLEAERRLQRITEEGRRKAEEIEREVERKQNEFGDKASHVWNSLFG